MIELTKRNLYVFFRDRLAVFFSLLSTFIIIGLFFLFLGDSYASAFNNIMENPRAFVDNWVMAGLIATTSVTAIMGSFSTMITDNQKGITKDFYSSPIPRKSLTAGYVFSSFIIGLILSLITFVFVLCYIKLSGGEFLSISSILQILLFIVLTTLANVTMIFFITTFFSSNSAFSAATTIISTLIGFITGIYIPVGNLPEPVQWIVKLFPTTHGAVLIRQVMTKQSFANDFATIPAEHITEIKHDLGISLAFVNKELTSLDSVLILIGFAILFFLLSVIRLSTMKKK